MSLEKAIEYRKEKRKAYRGSKAWTASCRNHGKCGYCENNRTITTKRALPGLEEQVDEYYGEHSLPAPEDVGCEECNKVKDGFCWYCRDGELQINPTQYER